MSRQDVVTGALAASLLAVGFGAWHLELRSGLRVDATPLETLPARLGEWEGVDVALDSTVESMLRADYNVQRAYTHPLGEMIWVYFGYYGTERGGRPEHTPAHCFRAHGWEVLEHRRLDTGDGLRVNEMLVSLDGEQQLVHYWFRSHRRTGLRGTFEQALDRLAGRVLGGRADGSLVRVSTDLFDGDLVAARSRLIPFAQQFDRQLAEHWPRESPDGLPPQVLGRLP